MGGKSGSSPPPAPDPSQLIQQQAQANRVNEWNPFGSSTYAQSPEGQWSRTTSLNPMLQSQLSSQFRLGSMGSHAAEGLLPQAYQNFSSPFNYGGLPKMSEGVNVGSAQSYNPMLGGQGPQLGIQGGVNGGPGAQTSLQHPGAVDPNQFDINSYYNKVYAPMAASVNKQYDRQQPHVDSQLAAQGIPLGSDAFHESQSIQNEGRNDALTRASSAAYGQALGASQNAFGQAMGANQNQFGQNLASGNFYNQGVGQNFGQGLASGAFGNQAQAQQFGQGMQGYGMGLAGRQQDIGLGGMNAGLQNQWHNQALQEGMQNRYMPYQEAQMMNQFQGMNSPNFSGTPQLDTTGPNALAYQGQMNAWNAQNANSQANNQGLFGMLGGVGQSLPWGQWFGG